MSYFGRTAVSRSISDNSNSLLTLSGLSKKQNFPLQKPFHFQSRASQKLFLLNLRPNILAQNCGIRNITYSVANFHKQNEKMALQAAPKELMTPMNVPQKLLMVSPTDQIYPVVNSANKSIS